jgi:hypothetical protein
MYYFIGALVALAIVIAAFLGYTIGKLKGEIKLLQELNTNKRRTHSDIALFEDALSVITDLRYRQRVEEKRDEAIRNYFYMRLVALADILGQGRNGFDYESKENNRPKDY